MELTLAHWIYLGGVLTIIGCMIARKDVVLPAILATALTAFAFTGSPIKALSSLFNASLVSATELFSIFLIIAVMSSLLSSMRSSGADKVMVRPFRKVMINGHVSFFVLLIVTYAISLFFYPTPAVPLVGLILLPVAIASGLPPMGAALAIAIAGQGMALSSDYVIQVAPGLSAAAAGVEAGGVADRAFILSLIVGGVAIALTYTRLARTIKRPSAALLEAWEAQDTEARVTTQKVETVEEVAVESSQSTTTTTAGPGTGGDGSGDSTPTAMSSGIPGLSDGLRRGASSFAILVPVVFGLVVTYLVLGRFTDVVEPIEGSGAAALVGGVATILLLAMAFFCDGRQCLGTVAEHVVEGFVFAFKAMAVVIPIAGFFFMGNGAFATQIMSLEEGVAPPAFLFDLVEKSQAYIPDNPIVMALAMVFIGGITGLDGSGFSGLPLTGSLAGALGPGSGMDVETLAALGQMGSIWVGGGVLIAWSSLLAVAGFTKVSAVDLVRAAFIPVTAGLAAAAIFAAVVW